MSRIYRSREQSPAVHDVDLRQTRLGPQDPNRPQGGIAGLGSSSAAGEGPVLTVYEQREQEAERLVEDAHRQAEHIQADAYQAGFEQGERAGEKMARQKLDPLLQTFGSLISAIQEERKQLISQHEKELIKVAFSIASQVVHHEIERVPQSLTDVINAAMAKVASAQEVVLLLSPIDKELLESQLELAQGIAFPTERLTIEADDAVERGGCRVRVPAGEIDALISTQLQLLKEGLWSDH